MYVSKIKLHNFRRFRDLEIVFNKRRNILVGDNESGKSSILQAIDITAKGSRHRLEDIGLQNIINITAISDFLSGDRNNRTLPIMFVELYLSDIISEELEGKNNSDGIVTCGLRLTAEPDIKLSEQIHAVISSDNTAFPFEFYSITFMTFANVPYNGFSRKLKTIFLDTSNMGSEYALNEYIDTIYSASLNPVERLFTKFRYGKMKLYFKNKVLSEFNSKLDKGYAFSIKNTGKNCLESDVSIEQEGVPITEKGSGILCFIKTKLALRRASDIPIIILEEPENHLSHINMRLLIDEIEQNTAAQLFIATHSDMISTRLNLQNCILMNNASDNPIKLDFVDNDTATFFMKAPDNNMLQFVLSKKVVLVEGDAEFILMDSFCKRVLNHNLSELGIEVISVNGKCFKRFLTIAQKLKMKVAVITDNDGDYFTYISKTYDEYIQNRFDNIRIFSDRDNARWTFEIAVYQDNQEDCENLFKGRRRTLTVEQYMLSNKAEAAFRLLSEKGDSIIVPDYIKTALEWVVSV